MILKELKIYTFIGEATNCYIIFDEQSKEIMCIDPAGDVDKIENLKRCGGKILIHRIDAIGLNDAKINLSEIIGLPEIELEADSRIDDNDLIHLGNLEFRVIHTPGHTAGSTSLYCEKEKCLFSGDTIFCGTWGRTDLPTSSREDIMN